MKSEFGARYVRLYGNCDASWHNDAWVAAAADAGLGVYGLVWFGWDNPNDWKWRMDALVKTITTNPKVRAPADYCLPDFETHTRRASRLLMSSAMLPLALSLSLTGRSIPTS